MIIDKIIKTKKPFAIVMIANRLGDDWFVIMVADDCEKLTGFHESRGFKGLKECDLDSDDVKVFREVRTQFKRTCIDNNMYVFNEVGSDFKTYFKRPQADGKIIVKRLVNNL